MPASSTPTNSEIAAFLTRLSELMLLNGDNAFRIRAMANGALMIDEHDVDVAVMSREGTLTQIEGVGKEHRRVGEGVHRQRHRAGL